MYISNYTPAHIQILYVCMCYVYDALEISPCLLLVYHALPRCLKIYSPVLLSLSLTHIACVNVLRGSSPPSTVVIFAVLRFSLFALKGLTPKRLNMSASPSHTRIQIVQIYVCMYVCTLVRVRSCARILRVGVWRRSVYWFCVVSLIKSREPVHVCVCVCVGACQYACTTELIVFICTLHSLIVIWFQTRVPPQTNPAQHVVGALNN